MTNVFFLFPLQFGNNNNYMNMADANGALLGADVSISKLEMITSYITDTGTSKLSFPCITTY